MCERGESGCSRIEWPVHIVSGQTVETDDIRTVLVDWIIRMREVNRGAERPVHAVSGQAYEGVGRTCERGRSAVM